MAIAIPGPFVCTAEVKQVVWDKTLVELQGLLRKASSSFQVLTKLLTCESFTSRNLLEGKQIQVAIV